MKYLKLILGMLLLLALQLALPVAAADIKSPQETLQQNFSVSPQKPVSVNFYATTPGPMVIDLNFRGAPVAVYLRTSTGQILASVNSSQPAGRLSYTFTTADFQKGYVFNLALASAGTAEGGFKAVYPQVNRALLSQQQSRAVGGQQPPAASQQQVVQRTAHVPLRYTNPRLAAVINSKLLTKAPVNLNQKIVSAGRQQLPFRPFTMEEVFDLQTGKPLFAHNIDERTGELILPPQLRTNVTVGKLLGAQDLQQKGFSAVQLKTPGAVRFGKLNPGLLTLKSRISIPRRDGMVSEAGVEDYLRELNDFEQQLNAVGQTLRDPQTGKIKTQTGVTTIGKLQRNEALLQQQLQKSRRLFDARTVYRPWSAVDLKGMEQRALAATPKRLLVPRNTWKDLPPGVFKAPAGVVLAPAASAAAKGAAVVAYPDCYLRSAAPDKGVVGMEVVLQGHNLAGCQIYAYGSSHIRLSVPSTPVDNTAVKVKIPQMPEGLVKFFAERPGGTPQPLVSPTPATPSSVSNGAKSGLNNLALQSPAAQQAQTAIVGKASAETQQRPGLASPAHAAAEIRGTVSSGNTGAEVQNAIPFEIVKNVYASSGGTPGSEPPPDYFSRDLQPFKRALVWGENYGDPSSFAVGLKTEFSIYSDGGADDNLVRFKGYGGAIGTLFNNDVEIIAAKGDISIPTGNTKNDNDLRANFRITAAGSDIYKWGKNRNQQTGTEQNDCAAEDKDVTGKCCSQKDSSGKCSDDGMVVQVRFEYKKHYELARVDYSAETHFSLGPVPMVARFGFRGEAGADLHAVVSPLQVIGKVTPYVKTSVYGECGVDLWFAEGGVGVSMTMLNLTVDAAGQAYINFGTLRFDVDAYVYLTYDALSGYVYAYVDAFGHRWSWDIANWDGFKGNIYLLPVQKFSYPLFPGA